MILLFTPYSFIYFSVYMFILFLMLFVDNFYIFWILMELLMLLYLGLSFTVFNNSYSQLMMFFMIQTLSSFMMFLSYLYSSEIAMTLSILLKLALFPFIYWFINVMYRFPNFIFWLSSTLHKVPVIYFIYLFSISFNNSLLWVSMILSLLFSGLMMLSVTDLRLLLILSSISNNIWFILSQYCSIFTYSLYFILYSLSLYFILYSLSTFLKPGLNFMNNFYPLSFWLLFSSGLPPFPVFFVKMFIISSLFLSNFFNVYFILLLLFAVFVVISYLNVLFKYFIYGYDCLGSLLLNY